jgi:hypothetical protein
VPITQTRMERVLAESSALVAHIEQLRSDAENIAASDLDAAHKVKLLLNLLHEPRPTTAHTEREYEHFQRATKRNEQSAKRMRDLRAKQQQQQRMEN